MFIVIALGAVVTLTEFYQLFVKSYTPTAQILVSSGDTLVEIASELNKKDVSISYYRLRVAKKLTGEVLHTGLYEFEAPVTAIELVRSITSGENRAPATQLTIPEGFSNEKIVDRLRGLMAENEFTNFDLGAFAELSANSEGYLYPDTYFIYPETTAAELYQTMRENFRTKTASLPVPPTADDIILASIIEREVSDSKDRRLVADILQRRLADGMRLQVDSTLDYYLGKESRDLTRSDLDNDHPFNSYVNYGLPPSPIANPSIDSIQAVLEPSPNDYWYFLSGLDGTTYYAKTLETHKENRQYLD